MDSERWRWYRFTRTLARHLGMTRTLIHEIWQKYDAQPHRVERFKLLNDPRFEERVRDIVGLYLNPPDHDLVLCVAEKSQIQALEAATPGRERGRAEAGARRGVSPRAATRTRIGGRRLAQGNGPPRLSQRRRHRTAGEGLPR